jgi:hypothetical protein
MLVWRVSRRREAALRRRRGAGLLAVDGAIETADKACGYFCRGGNRCSIGGTLHRLNGCRIVPSKPTRRQIAEQDSLMLARQAALRRAADAIAADLAKIKEVHAVALFGSLARPLVREVPRFQPFRRHGIEILHECGDIDLAIAIDRLDNLAALNRTRNRAVTDLFQQTGIGVAHHQIDVFLFGEGWNDYLGRLCTFAQCPKGKIECLTPGCGREPFLKQHEGFVLEPGALAPDRSVVLYERGSGFLRRASDLDTTTVSVCAATGGAMTT